jgi:tetratricopeptide (TPR) repeat protein
MSWPRIISLTVLILGMTIFQDLAAQTTTSEEANAERDTLFEALRAAPTESDGQAAADQIWRFWFSQAPDEASAGIMGKAMERRRQYDFAGAMELLDQLVAEAPDWPEAWNQRATVLYLQDKLDRSLDDVERVLALEPKHFGALAGKAVILMQQGRIDLGQQALRAALAIHPWLTERRMLLPEAPGVDL